MTIARNSIIVNYSNAILNAVIKTAATIIAAII